MKRLKIACAASLRNAATPNGREIQDRRCRPPQGMIRWLRRKARAANSKPSHATPRSAATFAAWQEVPGTADALPLRLTGHRAVRNGWVAASRVPWREGARALRTCRERAIRSAAHDRRTIGTHFRVGWANGLGQRRSSEEHSAKNSDRRNAGSSEFHLSLAMLRPRRCVATIYGYKTLQHCLAHETVPPY